MPSLRSQTIRVEVANANVLKNRKDAALRFVRAFRETLDWMYADPEAIKLYADAIKVPWRSPGPRSRNISRRTPSSSIEFLDIEGIMADAVRHKFLDVPLTKEQIAEFIQIPPR